MTSTPQSRHLGKSGPTVTSPGLGCMGLSGVYGPTDDEQGVRTIHAYLDAGGTLLDTGDFYGFGHNEWLIRQAPHASLRGGLSRTARRLAELDAL